ncbi:unnamed protein product, partial [Brassica rapa subsp. narinosa]
TNSLKPWVLNLCKPWIKNLFSDIVLVLRLSQTVPFK